MTGVGPAVSGQAGERILSIHYLRALAATMVVVTHLYSFAAVPVAEGGDRYEWLRHGVAIFFVISGFVMVESTRGGAQSPAAFMWRRFVRVVPFWWVMLSIWVLIGAKFTWPWLASSYALVPMLNPLTDSYEPVLGPGWTLFFEMAFYVLFALALFLPRRVGIWLVVAILCLLPLLRGLVPAGMGSLSYYMNWHVVEFAAGIVIAYCRIRLPWPFLPLGLAALWLLDGAQWHPLLAMGLPAALVVAGARGLDGRLPQWRIGELLGDASYAIYLSHMIVVHLVQGYIAPLDLPLLSLAVGLGGSLSLGVVIHRCIEKPLLTRLRRIGKRAETVEGAVEAPLAAPPTRVGA